jgi:phosphatidylglycerophosphate synthase
MGIESVPGIKEKDGAPVMDSIGRAGEAPGNTAPDFKPSRRFQQSVLAGIERTCLKWLAERMPERVKPDHLTLLGFGSMLMAGASYALASLWPLFLLIASFWLAVNWFGDSLDGTLARFRNKQRPRYGFYVDHMSDAFGTLFIACGLGLSGYISWPVALVALVAYSLLSINVYLATHTIGVFRLSFYGLSPTELRILLAIGNAVAFFEPRVFGNRFLFYDVAAVIATVLMFAVTIVSVSKNTIELYRAERV